MKLKDLTEGKLHFRKFVLELTKHLPFLTFQKIDNNPYKLMANGFVSGKDGAEPYRIEVNYGERHPMMTIAVTFPNEEFYKAVLAAGRDAGLGEPSSSVIAMKFYSATFSFIK